MHVSIICNDRRLTRRLKLGVEQILSRLGFTTLGVSLAGLDDWENAWHVAELVLVVIPHDRQAGLAVLRAMSHRSSQEHSTRCLAAVGPADGKLVLQSMRAGAADYIDRTDLDHELDKVMLRALSETGNLGVGGRVIAVLGASGGCGTSTVAANIAVSLAGQHKEAGLLDMRMPVGVLDSLLDLKPNYTLADLCHLAHGADLDLIERMFCRHASGTWLLGAPRELTAMAQVSEESVRYAVGLARRRFASVVADVDSTLLPEQLEVLVAADLILLVVRMDFTSLRNAQQLLRLMEQFEIDTERVRIVANRVGQPRGVPPARAQEALGVEFFQTLPDVPKLANQSINEGVPVVLSSPRSKLAKALAELARNADGWGAAVDFSQIARRGLRRMRRLALAAPDAPEPSSSAPLLLTDERYALEPVRASA